MHLGGALRRDYPPCTHLMNLFSCTKWVFRRGGFNLHLYSRPSCLLICRLCHTSFLCLKYCKLQPRNQSYSCSHDPAECAGRALAPSVFQILCQSNATVLMTLTHVKNACLPPWFPFPISLHLSIFSMNNTHSKGFFFSMVGAWFMQGPTVDK